MLLMLAEPLPSEMRLSAMPLYLDVFAPRYSGGSWRFGVPVAEKIFGQPWARTDMDWYCQEEFKSDFRREGGTRKRGIIP
jgi:hypothetical protein